MVASFAKTVYEKTGTDLTLVNEEYLDTMSWEVPF